MRAILDGLAESAVGEQATGVIVFAGEGRDMHLPVLNQALDHLLEEIRPAIGTSSMNSRRNHSTYCTSLIPSSVHRCAWCGFLPLTMRR